MVHLYRNWLLASRPWSFAMTAISVSVGAALAAIDGSFHWGWYLLTLVGAVLLHAATNLINDYYDVAKGLDTKAAATAQYRPHPMVEGLIPARQVRAVALALFGVATVIGLILVAARGWPILWIGLVGVLAGLLYTAPPLQYKYVALGEFSVFLMWGPLMVEGAYYVQRQAFSWQALWVSLPFGVLVALVLLANNIRDIEHDSTRPVKTIAILLGRRRGLHAYLGLMVLAYLGIVAMALFGVLPAWVLLILLSLPLAARLLRQMTRQVPADADARTAQLDTAFGVLLVLSLVLAGLIG
ncbi:MAG: 1,4-dihydroxy-2-naphthoate octaprenyltransferase [Candidatus Krumholzibacteriia bacterium]